MSKYTTEVRFICEQKSGLSESVGASDVDSVISKCWDKVFTSKVSFFDESYRKILCSKILKHYYLREIGCETVGVWLLWMNERLEMIMPYYNKLYESELIKFNPMYDVDLTRAHNRKNVQDDTGKRDTMSNRDTSVTNTSNTDSSNVSRDLYSDTPQGALTGVENETYLTNARKVSDSGNVASNSNEKSGSDFSENESTSKNMNSTEDYLESVQGKQGGGSYSDLLMKYRDTFLNIDQMVVEEFSDLFMLLW